MSKKMLINARYPEECRVAVIEDNQLLELEIERPDHQQLKGNIYRAPISRIEQSLQAAFLDIGSSRNGFLQINDINPACFFDSSKNSSGRNRPSIKEILRNGQDLVVQVVKDERAAKGATLTTNMSIPGRYVVLMIGNQRGGVSRKIQDESQRRKLKDSVDSLKIPAGMGVIVRTAGINKSTVELQKDLDNLLEIWYSILEKSVTPGPSPLLLYQESSLAIRTIRDYLTPDITEVLIDEEKIFNEVKDFIDRTFSNFETKLTFYDKPTPLFSYFHLDTQVDATNQSEVTLKSGGSIVINSTEAVVAVDVNSGRATTQSNVEYTAFETNKEAAIEVARQLRLRDLGGLIVIDFIDMADKRHKQVVERTLKDSVRFDKAKVEIGRISKFGLLEMSRQRIKTSLASHSHETCSQCQGRGKMRSPESVSLEALRKIQSAMYAGGVTEVRLQISPIAGLMLLNSKRRELSAFESETGAQVRVYPDGRLRPEEYHIEIVRSRGVVSTSSMTSPATETSSDRSLERGSDRGSERNGNQRNNRSRRGRTSDNRDNRDNREDRRPNRRPQNQSNHNRPRPENNRSEDDSRETLENNNSEENSPIEDRPQQENRPENRQDNRPRPNRNNRNRNYRDNRNNRPRRDSSTAGDSQISNGGESTGHEERIVVNSDDSGAE